MRNVDARSSAFLKMSSLHRSKHILGLAMLKNKDSHFGNGGRRMGDFGGAIFSNGLIIASGSPRYFPGMNLRR